MPARAFVERLRRPTAEQSTTETIAFGPRDFLSCVLRGDKNRKKPAPREEKRLSLRARERFHHVLAIVVYGIHF
jgi:hypothetical protein